MNKGSTRIALIGAGLIAESAHIPSILASERATLAAIVESNAMRAQALLSKFGITCPVFSDVSEAAKVCDAAVIATPNDSHHPLAIQCLRLGLDVLVEKPLANTFEHASEMATVAHRHDRVLMAGYCTRYLPSVQYLKNAIDSELFGRLKKFVLQFGTVTGWTPVSGYFLSKKQAGGGAFVINGSHYLDRMLYLFGEPSESAFFDDSVGGPEASALAKFKYERGEDSFMGEIRISKLIPLKSGGVFEFENATLIHFDNASPSLVLKLHGDRVGEHWQINSDQFLDRASSSMYLRQLEDFLDLCTGHSGNGISDIESAVVNVKLTETLYDKRKSLLAHTFADVGEDLS